MKQQLQNQDFDDSIIWGCYNDLCNWEDEQFLSEILKELDTKQVWTGVVGCFVTAKERVYDYVKYREVEDKCPNCNDLVYVKENFKKRGSMLRGE